MIITKITKLLTKALELVNRISDVLTYILIGALSCGVALILIFIIKKIVKCAKKRKAKKIQRAIERQQALEM